jgi:hypothetical protein
MLILIRVMVALKDGPLRTTDPGSDCHLEYTLWIGLIGSLQLKMGEKLQIGELTLLSEAMMEI